MPREPERPEDRHERQSTPDRIVCPDAPPAARRRRAAAAAASAAAARPRARERRPARVRRRTGRQGADAAGGGARAAPPAAPARRDARRPRPARAAAPDAAAAATRAAADPALPPGHALPAHAPHRAARPGPPQLAGTPLQRRDVLPHPPRAGRTVAAPALAAAGAAAGFRGCDGTGAATTRTPRAGASAPGSPTTASFPRFHLDGLKPPAPRRQRESP